MTTKTSSARVRSALKNRPPQVLHVYDRRRIMSRAWTLAREARDEQARQAFDLDVRVLAGRIVHNRPLSEHIAAIPLDLGAAQKRAWAEAKDGYPRPAENQRALIIVRHHGALATLRRIRFARVFRLMSSVANWIGSRFLPSRAA